MTPMHPVTPLPTGSHSMFVSESFTHGDIPAGMPSAASKDFVYSPVDVTTGEHRSRSPSNGPLTAEARRRSRTTTRQQYNAHAIIPNGDPWATTSGLLGLGGRDGVNATAAPGNHVTDFQVQMFAGPGREFGTGLFAGLGAYSSPKRKEVVAKELQAELARQIAEKRLRKELQQARDRQEGQREERRLAQEREDLLRQYEAEKLRSKGTSSTSGAAGSGGTRADTYVSEQYRPSPVAARATSTRNGAPAAAGTTPRISSSRRPKIDIDAEWAEWKKQNDLVKTPDQRPFDMSPERRMQEYERMRDEWEANFRSLKPPFVDVGAPPKVSFFNHEAFPDAYPRFGSALAREPGMQEEYSHMIGGGGNGIASKTSSGATGGRVPALAYSNEQSVPHPDLASGGPNGTAMQYPNRFDGTRARATDVVAQRESQITRLHRANNDSLQQELDKLKEQSKQQRVDIRSQMNNLKQEAHHVQIAHQKALYEDFMGVQTVLNSPVKEARALTSYELGLSGWNGPTMGEALQNELARPLNAESTLIPERASVLDALYGPSARKEMLNEFLSAERERLYGHVLYQSPPTQAKSAFEHSKSQSKASEAQEAMLRRSNWTALAPKEGEPEGSLLGIEKPPQYPTISNIEFEPGEIGYVEKHRPSSKGPFVLTEEDENLLRTDGWLSQLPDGREHVTPPRSPVTKMDPPIYVAPPAVIRKLVHGSGSEEEEDEGESNAPLSLSYSANATPRSAGADSLNADIVRGHGSGASSKQKIGGGWFNIRVLQEKRTKKLSKTEPEEDEEPAGKWFNIEVLKNRKGNSTAAESMEFPPSADAENIDYTLIYRRAADGSGGELTVSRDELQRLARSADTLYVFSDQHHFVKLRPGVRWPLNRLATGWPFSVGPSMKFADHDEDSIAHPDAGGEDDVPVEGEFQITEKIARTTWTGPCTMSMVYPFAQAPEVYKDAEAYLYHACYNAEGLQLLVGSGEGSCGWQQGIADDIKVCLGVAK
eukprot:g3155.t1